MFLIAAVLPGNPYPVTEHPFIPLKDQNGNLLSPPQFEMEPAPEGKNKKKPNPFGLLGQALKAGYQSHYTVVDSEGIDTAFPTAIEEGNVVSGELVVIESSQALPLFLVYYKAPSGKPGSGNTTGAAAAGSTASSSAGKFSC